MIPMDFWQFLSLSWLPPLSILITQLLNGVARSMLLFLISSGLTLILGVLGVVNFAHGSLYMLGAYTCYTIMTYLAQDAYSFWLALILAPIAIAIVGAIIELFLLRRVYEAEGIMQLLLTYALVLFFSDFVRLVWGPQYRDVNRPEVLGGAVFWGKIIFPSYNLFVLILGPLVAFFLWLILYRTKFGKTARAIAFDREMASALGVNVPFLYTTIFMMGCGLAGLGGALAAPMGSITPTMDISIIVESFVVVVIGGMGSFGGALLGALIVGVAHAFGILILPRIAMVSIFVVMAVVLILRPWGLLGNPLGPLTK
jgi:branched-subunit amino acid ABC-type transport system permease component